MNMTHYKLAAYLKPVTASKYFSSAFHILPTDPNNLAIRFPSSSVTAPPKLITINKIKLKPEYFHTKTKICPQELDGHAGGKKDFN